MSKPIVGQFTAFVGKRIANRRKGKKIPLEELARKIGVSAIVLENMEHGYCHINLEQIMLFGRYLSDTGELLGLPHYGDEKISEFINRRVDAMSEEDLRNWKARPTPPEEETYRLFILEHRDEEE